MVAKLTFYGGVGAIGGNKILLETENERVLLDFGRQIDVYSQYFSEFLQMRSKNALRDLLRLGVLPKINGIYTPWLVDMTTLFDEGVAGKVPVGEAEDYWRSVDVQPCNPEQPFVDGVFVSHAHFDHIQDVSFLDPSIPVYCTKQTKILAKAMTDVSPLGVYNQYYELAKEAKIRQKQSDPKFDYKILCPNECALSEDKEEKRPVIFDTKTKFYFTYEVAPKTRKFITALEGNIRGITYKLIPVGHSVPGACSVLLTLPYGRRVLYTGDIRFHGAGEVSIDDYVKAVGEGVDVMITEGTRVGSDDVLTEEQVGKDIASDICKCNGLVLISFGWKDLTRFKTVYEASKVNNRTLVISPKLAYLLYEMYCNFPTEYPDPRKMDNLQVYLRREGDLLYSVADYDDKWKLGYLHFHGRNMAKSDRNLVRIAERLGVGGAKNNPDNPLPEKNENCNYQDIYDLALHYLKHGVRAYEIRKNPQKYVLMFSFWDANELFDLIPSKGEHDTRYISASTEPFSEEMEIDENKMFQWMNYFNIKYDPEQDNEKPKEEGKTVFKRRHVSGHAAKPELQEVITKINPKILIPIHTLNPEKFKEIYQGKIIQPKYAQTIEL